MSRAKSFWAWGYEDRFVTDDVRDKLRARLATVLGGDVTKKPLPTFDATRVRPPRRDAPTEIAGFSTTDARARAEHTFGKGYPDLVRGFAGDFANAPDMVLLPETEEQIVAALAACSREKIALIPFGGGTSVVGGVEADFGTDARRFTAVASLDMSRFDKVLDVDQTSRAARIQAGANGPQIEEQLHKTGLTLRHFPQSYEHSTLGGWIATRAGGHFATGPTHIDDFVESVRMVTPKGIIETRRLPASGAGPSPERLILGSEGTFGVITEAWMRLQARPRWRASVSVHFARFSDGVLAARKIAQSGLYPSNCRLLDAGEAMMHEVASKGSAGASVLLLGFESADHPVEPWMERALSIATDLGGDCAEEPTYTTSFSSQSQGADVDTEQSAWRKAFFAAPYLQSALVSMGVMIDTFETAITWDRFDAFHASVSEKVNAALQKHTGGGLLTSRFSHVYPDGPAPYYTFVANVKAGSELAAWKAVKDAASAAVIEGGGTITHHHAVGRTHRAHWEKERAPLIGAALAAVKSELDPAGIMNPGALLSAPK